MGLQWIACVRAARAVLSGAIPIAEKVSEYEMGSVPSLFLHLVLSTLPAEATQTQTQT